MEIRPPTSGMDLSPQRWDVDLVDQVSQECRLGEDLDVEKRRRRLERDRRQFFETMELARGMDVVERDGEDQQTHQRAEPPSPLVPTSGRATADGMVAVVDGFQKGVQVSRGPGLRGGGHQDE